MRSLSYQTDKNELLSLRLADQIIDIVKDEKELAVKALEIEKNIRLKNISEFYSIE